MKLSAEGKEALDAIRAKVNKKNADLNEDELIKLNAVYNEVLSFNGVHPVRIDKTCSSCKMEALNIVSNYVQYYEPATPQKRTGEVKEVKDEQSEKDYQEAQKEDRILQQQVIKAIKEQDETLTSGYGVKSTGNPSHTTKAAEPEPAPVKKTRKPRTVKPKAK